MPAPPTYIEARVAAHVDDTTVLARDTASINIAIGLFNLYGKASGASLNMEKSIAGEMAGKLHENEWPSWLECRPTVKICGLYYGKDAQATMEEELKHKLTNIVTVLKTRRLTHQGKVILVNTILLAKVWYLGTVII